MIREKYQFSGYGSVEGFGAIPPVATYAARFMKKDYGISGNFAADPLSSDMMLGVHRQRQLQKELDASERKLLSVANGEVDPAIAVSAVCVGRDRFYEAERDRIRRFQRGDYDGEFLIGGNRNKKDRGGDEAVDNMLKKLGDNNSNENALQQRRGSFVMHKALGRTELFLADGDPNYPVAFKEGLSEDQSRELLRRMEAMHRGQREEQRRWDEDRRIKEADDLRRRTREEDDDELRRLKERLNKANTRMDEASHDVQNLDEFLSQLNELKKKFGQGGAVGEDAFLGDEFMDNEGAIHNLLVHDHSRHLPPGAVSRKQRLYRALHYGAAVGPEDGEEGTAHKGGKDAHTKCPCCGKNMNDVSDRHNPLRAHLERLKKEVQRQRAITLLKGDTPVLTETEMAAVTSCQKATTQDREEAQQRHKERNIFHIPKTEQEKAEQEYRRVKRHLRRAQKLQAADECAVCTDPVGPQQTADGSSSESCSSSSDVDLQERENELDEQIMDMCDRTLFNVTNTGTLKTLEFTDDRRGTYERFQEVRTAAHGKAAQLDGTCGGDESGSLAAGGMLTIHQQRRLAPASTPCRGAPPTMSSIRASTGGAIISSTNTPAGELPPTALTVVKAREMLSSLHPPPPPRHQQPLVFLQPTPTPKEITVPVVLAGGGRRVLLPPATLPQVAKPTDSDGIPRVPGNKHVAFSSHEVATQPQKVGPPTMSLSPLVHVPLQQLPLPVRDSESVLATKVIVKVQHDGAVVRQSASSGLIATSPSVSAHQSTAMQPAGSRLTTKPRKGAAVVINIAGMKRN